LELSDEERLYIQRYLANLRFYKEALISRLLVLVN